MAATVRLTRGGVGIELRRGTYEVLVDGNNVGSIDLHGVVSAEVPPGQHSLQIRRGRYCSPARSFDALEGETVPFRCHGANIWPRWLLSYAVPTLAIALTRE